MRKKLSIIIAVCLIGMISACGNKKGPEDNSSQTEVSTENTAEAEVKEKQKEEPAGMANPMVEINDPAEFEKQLGINIDPAQITSDTRLFVIAGNLAHITWTQKNVNNEDVEFVLRATKDTELGPNCHGIYGTYTDQNDIEIPGGKPGQILSFCRCDNYGIYTWKNNDVFYSLTYNNDMSQMALAEVLDQVMFATGTVTPNKLVGPLPVNTDINNIEDGIYNVSADFEKIKTDNGKYTLQCDIFTRELFDVVDVHTLIPGDTVIIGGDFIVDVETVEEDNGEIVINGGDEDKGGCILHPGEGGTYYYRGLDDMPSFTFHGTTELEISENVILTDTSNLDNKCAEVIVNGAKDVIEYIRTQPFVNISPGACSVLVENKTITEIKTWYTP